MNRLSFLLIVVNVTAVSLVLFWSLGELQQNKILRFINLALFRKPDKEIIEIKG